LLANMTTVIRSSLHEHIEWTEFAGLDIEEQRMTIYKGIFYLS